MFRAIHRARAQKGFTLIELLIVVAIIGIIAAILIPNLIDALQKAKQKRAMADVRNVGGAWFTWLTDQLSAAAAGAGQTYTWGDFDTTISAADLLTTLFQVDGPVYLQTVPERDPWGGAYDYRHSNDILAAGDHIMGIRSLGQNGAEEFGGAYVVEPFKSSDFVQDIAWADGFFVRWPEGAQAVAAGGGS